jgi:hypothetical protein
VTGIELRQQLLVFLSLLPHRLFFGFHRCTLLLLF